MKYIVEIPTEVAKKIDGLVNQGKYESISQFANTAFQNQLLLEESPKEILENLIETPISKLKPVPAKPQFLISNLGINFNPGTIRTVNPPETNKTPNDCLWGQYNRIFPVKITLRILANMLKDDETVELDLLYAQAVQAAREVGLLLKKEDKKSKRKYGDLLSSALPVGKDLAKTEKRFMNHFVGYSTRAGRIEGAPGAQKFLDISEDEENVQSVGITESGLKFATLKNSVLDEGNFNTTLTREESLFYIKNVFENLPKEKELNVLILKAIEGKKSSPEELNTAIKPLSRGWSDSMVNTMKAGAISRLNELGLISRSRHGFNINYSLTDFGRDILSNNIKGD